MTSSSSDHPERRDPVSAEELIFNDNLQEFATKIGHICNLEISGKIPPELAYKQIRELWKMLKRSKKNLGIGQDSSN